MLQLLLCGVFIAHPEDSLTFLDEKLREIMAKRLDIMTKELCKKEWDFYGRNLMKLYFGLEGKWDFYQRLKLVFLQSFPSLQMSLAHCRKFTDKGLPYLDSKGCHKIICLEIPGFIQLNSIGGKFSAIRHKTGKNEADVFRNTVNGCNWIQDLLISKMLTLTDRFIVMSVFFLDSPKLSETTFHALAECKLLKVSIEGYQNTDLNFKLMRKCCPYIWHIHEADCQKITEAGVKMISPLKHILLLNMADFQAKLTVDGLRTLGCHGKTLELSISQFKNFSDNGIQGKEHCHVSYCPLTDEAVKIMAFHCQRLASVNIVSCPKMIDTCIQYFATVCHYLSFLDISGCIHLSDDLKYLWKGCEQLQILMILYCRKITKKIFPHLNSETSLKYTAELEKQEHNDADPPSWLGYVWDGNITTFTKKHRSEPEKTNSSK
ncbi:LOW QUALITY PROTEIN: F-box and leucine-rich repeat protein 13 [Acridotheres tristis]